MEVSIITQELSEQNEFKAGQVATMSSGHLSNDIFTGFVPTLLPLLIDKLSLSLTAAGSLSAMAQIPSLLNPFFGYLSDRYNLQVLAMLAPAVTATMITTLGLAPNPFVLAVLLFVSGISTAAFHATAPALVGRVSGKQVGKAMSWFMAGGVLGFSLGPLLVVWSISAWSLEGVYRLMLIGWATSLVLLLRLRRVPILRENHWTSIRPIMPHVIKVFLPLGGYILFSMFLIVPATVYLPTFMMGRHASFWMAGVSLSIVSMAGVVGTLISGPLSDRWGRKPILIVTIMGGSLSLLLLVSVGGWLTIPALIMLGVMVLSTGSVMLAVVQEHFPKHRAVTNGLYMGLNFVLQPVATVMIGVMGDRWGLATTFLASGVIALLSIPAITTLPKVNG
jgi:FSR family fosmidomycin resistance protein-like MFS transporter